MTVQQLSLLLPLAVFVTITALVYSLSQVLTRRMRIQKRLERTEMWAGQAAAFRYVREVQQERESKRPSSLSRVRKAWVNLARRLQKGRRRQKLRLQLQRAGVALTPEEYTAFLLAAVGIVGVAGYILVGSISTAAVAMVLVYLGARVQLQAKQRRRIKAFDAQLADALSMLSNSLKAGYSFFQAMDVVSKEMDAPLSDEFRAVIRETSVGMDVADALQGMVQRVPSEDLDLVITAVLIQRQVGGNLSEILDKIGNTIRERVRLKGEVKTLTAQGRASGLIIALLPFGVAAFVFMVNPGYVSLLFTHPLGRMMLGTALIGQMVGGLLIRKIVQVDI